ncbi:MAG TPA: biotin/lipoyl-binding protein, partial [Sphingomicrobium sp.]
MNRMPSEQMTAAAATKVRRSRKVAVNKGLTRTILMFIVPALLILGGGYYWLTSGGSVSTDDAQIRQDIVSVSPQVNGQVVEVLVRNGSRVKHGDLLFRIDPQPYRVALEQAEATLANARLQTHVLR